MSTRTDKLLSFLKEIEKSKLIERQVFLSTRERPESDPEHAWHAAMFVIIFQKELPADVDPNRILKMVLIHDLVEIYAGDTFEFDRVGKKSQKLREMKAARKLFGKLPSDLKKEFWEMFLDFENEKTKEGKYAKSFDKLQPILQNLVSRGGSWIKHNVNLEDIDNFKRKYMKHDEFIMSIYKKFRREIKKRKMVKDK